MRDILPQFQTDYTISWDFSDKDLPCVAVAKLKKDGATIVAEFIGRSHEKVGCVSLRQVLEDYEAEERAKAERAKDCETLRRAFRQREAENTAEHTEQEEGKT